MNEPLVSVVVCTRNRARSLDTHALASLSRQDYPRLEVVVVDDASTDDTRAVAESRRGSFMRLVYVRTGSSRGLCFARNAGVRHAAGEIIAFIDDDSSAHPGWLGEIAAPYRADPGVACVGGRSLIGDSEQVSECEGVILGCNMSFAARVFAHHAFDENLHFDGCSWFDETDLVNRLIRLGEKVVYNERAVVRHYRMPGEHRPRSVIGGPLNYLYMTRKHVTLREYLRRVWRFTVRGQRASDAFPCHPRSTSWGFSAAGRLLGRGSGLGRLEKARVLAILLLVVPWKARRARRTGLPRAAIVPAPPGRTHGLP